MPRFITRQIFLSSYLETSNPVCFVSFFVDKNFVFCNTATIISAKFFSLLFTFFKFDFIVGLSNLFDFWAVDLSTIKKYFALKFSVHYMFFNINYPTLRFIVNSKLLANAKFFSLGSLTNFYWSSNWLEREVFDLFGIRFYGNPDLRRLLTDYGFVGYPMRKDFPLSGYSQVRYDEDLKVIVSEPVTLTQKYRYFDFFSPWKLSRA